VKANNNTILMPLLAGDFLLSTPESTSSSPPDSDSDSHPHQPRAEQLNLVEMQGTHGQEDKRPVIKIRT